MYVELLLCITQCLFREWATKWCPWSQFSSTTVWLYFWAIWKTAATFLIFCVSIWLSFFEIVHIILKLSFRVTVFGTFLILPCFSSSFLFKTKMRLPVAHLFHQLSFPELIVASVTLKTLFLWHLNQDSFLLVFYIVKKTFSFLGLCITFHFDSMF